MGIIQIIHSIASTPQPKHRLKRDHRGFPLLFSASPGNAKTEVRALVVGTGVAALVADSLGALTKTGGESEVCNDVGGGDRTGDGKVDA